MLAQKTDIFQFVVTNSMRPIRKWLSACSQFCPHIRAFNSHVCTGFKDSTTYEPSVNGSYTKCAYVWMGLQTCAALSANCSHTICHKSKFVSFLRETKGIGCTVCPVFASGLWKINLPRLLANCLQTAWFACVFRPLHCSKLPSCCENLF